MELHLGLIWINVILPSIFYATFYLKFHQYFEHIPHPYPTCQVFIGTFLTLHLSTWKRPAPYLILFHTSLLRICIFFFIKRGSLKKYPLLKQNFVALLVEAHRSRIQSMGFSLTTFNKAGLPSTHRSVMPKWNQHISQEKFPTPLHFLSVYPTILFTSNISFTGDEKKNQKKGSPWMSLGWMQILPPEYRAGSFQNKLRVIGN